MDPRHFVSQPSGCKSRQILGRFSSFVIARAKTENPWESLNQQYVALPPPHGLFLLASHCNPRWSALSFLSFNLFSLSLSAACFHRIGSGKSLSHPGDSLFLFPTCSSVDTALFDNDRPREWCRIGTRCSCCGFRNQQHKKKVQYKRNDLRGVARSQ